MSHGIFAKENPYGDGDDRDTYNEGGGERSWRGRERQGRGERGRGRGGGGGGSRGYSGRGRGRGYGGRSRGRGGPSRRNDDEDDEGEMRIEGKRWSEKGGLKKISPGYGRGGIFSRLGGRGGEDGEGGGRNDRGGGGVFGRLNWGRGGGGGVGGGGGGSRGQQWHKVTIYRGGNLDQDELIKHLQSGIDSPLQPSNIHVIRDKLMFFLENPRAASQLKRLGRVDIDNDSLTIRVFPSPPPKTGRGGGSGGGGFGRDRDGDEMMGEPSDRGGHRGGSSWGRGGRPWERGGRGGRRDPNYDGDVSMKQDTTAVLLACLGQRYHVGSKSLDLSNMYHDPHLKENGVRGSMYSREFASLILEMIGTNCPELQALDMSSNQLRHLDAYSTLPSVCPSLQTLNFSENELQSVQELEKLSGMGCVTSLVIEGNPFIQSGIDVMSLASTLRKIFPNIQTVDGEHLPSQVKFELPETVGQLPPTQKGFVVNDEVQKLVVEFVKQYYSLFDGNNREKLFEAYTEDAVFSLSVARRDQTMDAYMPLSHNLARMKDPGRRQSLIKHGRIDIVQCLRDLPPTKNHLSSFNVDVMRATQTSTAFTIYGFFSEVGGGGGSRVDGVPVLAFTRVFVLTAVGQGIAVTNDQMTLRPASAAQKKIARDELGSLQQQVSSQPTASLQTVPEQTSQQSIYQIQPQLGSSHATSSGLQPSSSSTSSSPSLTPQLPSAASFSAGATAAAAPPSFSNSAQHEAVMNIVQTTGMNLEWSKKCLSENEWDFNKAVTAFTLLNGQGRIPKEAFHQ